jgi:hypothetical protein
LYMFAGNATHLTRWLYPNGQLHGWSITINGEQWMIFVK